MTAVMTVASAGCGIIGPTCTDETSAVLNVSGRVEESQIAAYSVISLKNSNLVMRLTWPDTAATLRLSATITACGSHAGCLMDTILPTFGPGGPSPTPQPWPPGLREMRVDGFEGKDLSGRDRDRQPERRELRAGGHLPDPLRELNRRSGCVFNGLERPLQADQRRQPVGQSAIRNRELQVEGHEHA